MINKWHLTNFASNITSAVPRISQKFYIKEEINKVYCFSAYVSIDRSTLFLSTYAYVSASRLYTRLFTPSEKPIDAVKITAYTTRINYVRLCCILLYQHSVSCEAAESKHRFPYVSFGQSCLPRVDRVLQTTRTMDPYQAKRAMFVAFSTRGLPITETTTS